MSTPKLILMAKHLLLARLMGFFLFASNFGLMAQSSLQDQYPFLNLEKNVIRSEEKLASFWQKLKSLEEYHDRQVQVLHIGDSHIQADLFTGEVRRLFKEDKRFPMAGRGFVFPYTLAKTNNPFDYQISFEGEWEGHRSVLPSHSSDWGLAGVSASTIDPNARFSFQLAADQDFPITIVKLFFPVEQAHSFRPVLHLEDKKNRIVSTTKRKGMVEFRIEKPVRKFSVSLEARSATQREFVLQGLWIGNFMPGVVYSASGANGARIDTYFRCNHFYRDLKYLRPDLLVISLGTNDAYANDFSSVAFQKHLQQMLEEIREQLPELPILLTTPGDSFRQQGKANPDNKLVGLVIVRTAQQYNCAVWDFFEVMGGYQSITHWRESKLAQPDMLHLTPTGYQLQGKLFFEALMAAYRNAQTRLNRFGP